MPVLSLAGFVLKLVTLAVLAGNSFFAGVFKVNVCLAQKQIVVE
ncbi:hypothetical protein [uncultured Ruthenibacterium sp.]